MRRAFSAFVIILAVAFTLAGCRRGAPGEAQQQQQDEQRPPFTLPQSSGAVPAVAGSYADLVARVAPAVVTIRAERQRAPRQHPFLDDPSLRDFFGGRQPQEQPPPSRQRALGSGVVVSADGYIITNHHVVDGAEQIKVEFTDRRSFPAKLVGTDQPSDLAVLKIEAKDLPMLTLGDSDKVRVGDVVLAVGNPLGVGQTVTSGIVSAKGRYTGLSDGSFEDFIQTDAAINQGNSGGALVSTAGELVGINSQILSPSGGNIGIGFAIPSNMTRTVTEQLVTKGRVRRGQLGVVVQPLNEELAQSFDLKEVKGVIVSTVQPGSAAEKAGLRRGDVVLAYNGAPVNEPNELRNLVAATQPGTDATLMILRDGREQEVKVTVGELQPNSRSGRDVEEGEGGGRPSEGGSRLGIGVTPFTPELAERLRLPADREGLVVTNVDPTGPAADAGLRQGDLIEQANRAPVRSTEDLRAAIEAAGERPVLLLVTRGSEGSTFITIRPRR